MFYSTRPIIFTTNIFLKLSQMMKKTMTYQNKQNKLLNSKLPLTTVGRLDIQLCNDIELKKNIPYMFKDKIDFKCKDRGERLTQYFIELSDRRTTNCLRICNT